MINLLDFDQSAMSAFFAERGDKPFRAKQALRWIHHALADRVESMTDLARSTRDALINDAEIRAPLVVRDSIASDGTRKWLLDVGGGNAVEAVYIPEGARNDWRGDSEADSHAGAGLPSAGRSRSAGPSANAPGRPRNDWRSDSEADSHAGAGLPSAGRSRS
ncbi:MAG: hypothetical protein M3Z74_07060, partial [Pseudomonadota bacterium]|nr:hypothetical protein [Pseudomonadota bacterium]